MTRVDQLPLEIRESTRAVVWRFVIRDGKPTKPPFRVRRPHEPAAVDDSSTWATLAEALAVVRAGKADGVGIILGDGLVGVDLDHCRDPDTGAITLEALAIVRALASYAEVSPSGTGLHILAHGTLPAGRRRNGKIEMYAEARYFTITGMHVAGTPMALEERTAALATVHAQVFGTSARPLPEPRFREPSSLDDTALIERAHAARNGAKFAALWRGDWSGYPSQSEADQALANLLGYWTDGDAARVDRLFRRSRLMRSKWDERRGERTYGERTIATAIAGGVR